MSLSDSIGYLAASLVFTTFCMQRMISLRSIAIASNLAFIGYAYLDSLWPILILHSAMLPLNIQRYRQSVQALRSAATANPEAPALSGSALSHKTRSLGNWISAALGLLRAWWERVGFRRELSLMSARDFGDRKVPPSLVADELRRWPWKEPSPQWRAAASRWSAGT
jgi:hypothetical protein